MIPLIRELWLFGLKQARSAIFAGLFFGLLVITQFVEIPGIYRYDLILFGAIAIQIFLVWTGLETWDELKVIALFHVIGLALEIYKTQPSVGSWSYPEPGLFKIAGVPLYSGFMYSAVGSHVSQAWRVLKLRLVNYPRPAVTITLSVVIYANFFTNHSYYDIRWFLIVAVVVVFRRTRVYFMADRIERWMPLYVSFALIAFFVWVAENISTLLGAWQYPDQSTGWTIVNADKVVSWTLLVIICFVAVADLKHLKAQKTCSS